MSSNILNIVLKNISELFILEFVHKKFEVQKISMSQISESSTINHKHDSVLFFFKKCIKFKCRPTHCIVGIANS